MNGQRRCDGCAYWEAAAGTDTDRLGTCHHNVSSGEEHSRAPYWWCEQWWPKARDLPSPWLDVCPHGYQGVCMYCLRDAIREGMSK